MYTDTSITEDTSVIHGCYWSFDSWGLCIQHISELRNDTIFASQDSYLIQKFSGVPTYLLRDVKGKKGLKTCTLFGAAIFSTVNTVAKLHIVHYWGSDITTIYIKPSYYAERLTHQLQSDEVLWFWTILRGSLFQHVPFHRLPISTAWSL